MDENEIKGTAKEGIGRVKDAVGGLTGDTSTQAEGKYDQVAGKVQGQFGAAADNLADKTSDFAGRAADTARDAAKTVRREAGDMGEKIYDAGARAGQYVGRTVEQQPLLSLLGVAAIGYFVSFLIHSPSSPLAPPPSKQRYF